MSKVFRLYNIQGNNNIVGWQESKVYGTQAISEINDPDGADAKKEITSIPSPFARIDLIKTAFREVVAKANLNPGDKEYAPFDGETIYHKMVSDTFDVAEIFFNYDRFKNDFEIIVWDREKNLDESNVFGKTLKRYLESDATGNDPYNFGKMERIYILNYTGNDRPASMNIVGATSPATLFFPSANDLTYVAKHVSFGQDRPFDADFQPLFKRDFEFQKYLYAFRKAYGEGAFHKDFPEVDDYLMSQTGKVCNYTLLTQKQKDSIDALDANSIDQYETIPIGENGENTFQIMNKPFHKKTNVINWKSDFEIKSDLYTEGKKPLVLPVEKGNTYENLKYTTDKWGKDNRAPYYDEKPWTKRCLPVVKDEYPYLTISDFLADTIVRMPYQSNDESFFNGNLPQEATSYKDKDKNTIRCSFMLPLTDTFFKFFTAKNLQGTIENNKKMFELVANAGGIKAILRIPIQKGYIEYSRIYFETSRSDIEHNDGVLIEKKFGLGVLPLVAFPENVKKHYRIALFDKGEKDINLTCYKRSKSFKEEAHIIRKAKDLNKNLCSIESYVITDNFDRINVELGETSGVIIPKFNQISGNKFYTFAIDFGTTNSHIEYSVVTSESAQNSVVNAFDIPLSEKQMHRLHDIYTDLDIKWAFDHNFIPDTIADKDNFSFPMRTAFAEWNNNDRTQNIYALANGNIPFLYEKRTTPIDYNELFTELKWRGEEEYPLVKMFLENVFILLRNKVALTGGNLEATKIIWFYPASMDTSRCDDFNDIWTKLYTEYFGNNADSNLIMISESAAPYRYYRKKKGAKSEVVTIDVGGGTTDVYIVEGDQPKMLLSFLFASNAIFGDASNWDSDSNGFVNLYYKLFFEILTNCKHEELARILDEIERKKKSTDIVAFLFSLFTNKEVKGNEALNFMLKLSQNKKLKYVFILFYSAILYFIAKSMHTNLLKRPLTLAFSGNGSKTLRILSPNNKTIGKFAKLIFDGVYGTEGKDLDIIFEDEPKKATSKGGVLDPTPQTPDNIKKIKFTLIGDDLENAPIGKVKFEDITGEVQEKIIDSVITFFDFLFQLHDDNDEFLTRSIGADDGIIDEVKEICKDREKLLSQSLKSALNTKKGSKVIEETLFFYPLIDVLHELALRISRM
jgi:hypothetical protein